MEPLVQQEVDLRGLPWMRLDTSRLLDSDLFALSTGDEFKAAVALWCKSWTQSPAGSLPTDDRILAHLSGAGGKWKRVRAMALRGWVECSDGRLYHPVVAEQVLAAWEERVAYREKIDGQNTRQQKLRAERAELMAALKEAGVQMAWNAPIAEVRDRHAKLAAPVTEPNTAQSRACHGDSHGLDGTGRDGTGVKEQKPVSTVVDMSPEPAAPDSDDGLPRCPTKRIVALYHEVLPELPPVQEFPEASVKMLRQRWRSDPERQSLDWWRGFFGYVRKCPFLLGEKTDFTADLLWLVRPTNFAKVLNGNYEERVA